MSLGVRATVKHATLLKKGRKHILGHHAAVCVSWHVFHSSPYTEGRAKLLRHVKLLRHAWRTGEIRSNTSSTSSGVQLRVSWQKAL